MNRLPSVAKLYPHRQKRSTIYLEISYQIRFNSSRRSHASILHGLTEAKPLQQVHAHVVTTGLSGNIFLCNRIMNSYASCGLIDSTLKIFCRLLDRNLFSWTILISGFTKNYLLDEAIEAFREMIFNNILPNAVSISTIIPAFGKLELTREGKSVHCYWIRQGNERNVFLETALVDMYSKFGCMGVARYLFDNMPVKNLVSWNAIILGYSNNGSGEEALCLFNWMRRKGISTDVFTIMSLISASLSVEYLHIENTIHGLTTKVGFENDRLVKSALMELYINADCLQDAYCIFNEIPKKDIVAWTSMLSGFSRTGNWNRTIEHFNKMMGVEGLALDSICLISILSGCSNCGALQQGRRMHALVIKGGFEGDIFVGSAVIDMYANCAELGDAERYFEWMKKKDIVCWNTLIAGIGMNGNGHDAIDLFLKMKGSGINPDESTLLSVLCACSYAGMVDDGLQIFHHMVKSWGIVPNLKHYACVIDLLGRAGHLYDAYSLACSMHLQPGIEVYGALLNACRVHRKIDLGVEVSHKLFELKPFDVGYYVLVSNMYALAGNFEDVKKTRALLRLKRLKKDPGVSLIEINKEIYTFMASQKDHPQYKHIHGFLKSLILKLKAEGYVPDIESVFQDVSDDMKEDILYHHSEKLAIAFGLIRTKQGAVLRITKNLRTCSDCHSASKLISKVFKRILIIRDANRFHVFQDGICSCRDYW